MPNRAIQSCHSTNWKSALAGSKRDQSSSVSANTSTEMTSAIRRIPLSCCSSSRMISKARAARMGRAIWDVRIGKRINGLSTTEDAGPASEPSQEGCSSPQVVAQHQNDTQEQRGGVGSHRPGLRSAQQLAQPAHDYADAVDRAVDRASVEDLPQTVFRDQPNRLNERSVVNLVDVILVEQRTPETGEAFCQSGRHVAALQKEEGGKADPCKRDGR